VPWRRSKFIAVLRIASQPPSTRSWADAQGAIRVTFIEPVERKTPTIYVCITCRRAGEDDVEPRPGALLAAATAQAAAGTEVTVRRVQCLANCTRGASAAMRCNGSWTYIFGGLDPTCGPALVDGARLLAQAADGIMPWRGRPEPLKRGLIARVPPSDFTGELE
jgi:predicted metal-binding protein